MLLYAIIAVCGLAGLLFLIFSARRLRQWRLVAGGFHGLVGVCFLLAAATAWLLGFSLLTYERLTHEQLAVEVMLSRLGERHYRAILTYPSRRTQAVELRGDEWQIDARVLKWRGLANIAGFDTVYRLERISGRYGDIDSARRARSMRSTSPRASTPGNWRAATTPTCPGSMRLPAAGLFFRWPMGRCSRCAYRKAAWSRARSTRRGVTPLPAGNRGGPHARGARPHLKKIRMTGSITFDPEEESSDN
jgi:hypothetical protein